jgi:hypothetical protein
LTIENFSVPAVFKRHVLIVFDWIKKSIFYKRRVCHEEKKFYLVLYCGCPASDSWYKNGEDQTTEFLVAFYHYRITFHSDGYFTEEYQTSILLPITITITGTWEVTGKPGAFQLQLTDESQVRIFNIKKLTKNTVDIYRDLGGSDNEEFFLEPVPE